MDSHKTVAAIVALGTMVVAIGCGSLPKVELPKVESPKVESTIRDTRKEQPKSIAGYYSEKYHYRVVYPADTSVSPLPDSEGESFAVRVKGAIELEGKVSGRPNQDPALSSAALCQHGIDQFDGPEGESMIAVSYKVVKPDWYVFSGTIGGKQIHYEKGLAGGSVVTLHLEYWDSEKELVAPLVTRIANSFERYTTVAGKVGYLAASKGEPAQEGTPGTLWLNDVANEVQNVHTRCYFDAADSGPFVKLREGQAVTVAGKPDFVVLRESTEQYSGLYENRIDHCTLR